MSRRVSSDVKCLLAILCLLVYGTRHSKRKPTSGVITVRFGAGALKINWDGAHPVPDAQTKRASCVVVPQCVKLSFIALRDLLEMTVLSLPIHAMMPSAGGHDIIAEC